MAHSIQLAVYSLDVSLYWYPVMYKLHIGQGKIQENMEHTNSPIGNNIIIAATSTAHRFGNNTQIILEMQIWTLAEW